jgi:hypothetical protein
MTDESPRWRTAIHEASHAVMALVHGGTVNGMRMHHKCVDTEWVPSRVTDAEQGLVVFAMVEMAGYLGEDIFCGGRPHPPGNDDDHQLERHLKTLCSVRRWPLPAVQAVLEASCRDLLQAHDRLVYKLANALETKQHLYHQDCMELFFVMKKLFGVAPSPWIRPGWADYLDEELAER